jgi:hypothetical protein
MPLFEFTSGSTDVSTSVGTGSTASISFTDTTIAFTASTNGSPFAFNAINYSPDNIPDNGVLSFTNSGTANPFTLVADADAAWGATGTNNISLVVGDVLTGAWNVTFVNAAVGGMDQQFTNVSANQVLSFASAAEYSGVRFTPTMGSNSIRIDSLTANIVCYLEGTGIATPIGDVAVQDLRPGDVVMTADGAETTVKWVGEQPVQTRLTHPARVNPICLTAGSIGENVPARDLFVSPDHAIAIDGALYNASTLVNGASIYMVAKMPLDGFTYYHVETDAHEVILAEGCPAESYLDMPDRTSFVNGGLRADAPRITEMDMARITSKRLVPQGLQDQLAARAEHTAIKAVRAA